MSYLDVPGARLYYETRGSGPLLFLIGSPMDSAGFVALAQVTSATHSVVTYDPRGIGNSTREDAEEDITPELQADDVHRLIGALSGGGPVDYLGSSGGAVVGLALVQARPGVLRTLIAHEPPVIEMLPDSAQQRAAIQAIYDAYTTHGWQQAMQMFMTHIGMATGGAPHWEPSPEQLARMEETNKVFFGHLIRQTTAFRPDITALKAAQTRIVVGVGASSEGQLAHRTGLSPADELDVQPVVFPGDHAGFIGQPSEFAEILQEALR